MFVIPSTHNTHVMKAKANFLQGTKELLRDSAKKQIKILKECMSFDRVLLDICRESLDAKSKWYFDNIGAGKTFTFVKYYNDQFLCNSNLEKTGLFLNNKIAGPGKRKDWKKDRMREDAVYFWDTCLDKNGELLTKAALLQAEVYLIGLIKFYKRMIWIIKSFINCRSKIYYEKIQKLEPAEMMNFYDKYFVNNTRVNWKFSDGNRMFIKAGVINCGVRGTVSGQSLDAVIYKEFIRMLFACFPYESFTDKKAKYGAYALCKDLDIRVCLYCNANYTYTIAGIKRLPETYEEGKEVFLEEERNQLVARPELDHYFPKSKFPMFQMSFYNLIPSCSICNGKIKGKADMDINTHLHPYQKSEAKIKFQYKNIRGDIKIMYTGKEGELETDKTKRTVEFFKTGALYGCYQDEVRYILKNSDIYDPLYIAELERFTGKKIPKRQILCDLLGYVEEKDIINTPLGKVKHDLAGWIMETKYM